MKFCLVFWIRYNGKTANKKFFFTPCYHLNINSYLVSSDHDGRWGEAVTELRGRKSCSGECGECSYFPECLTRVAICLRGTSGSQLLVSSSLYALRFDARVSADTRTSSRSSKLNKVTEERAGMLSLLWDSKPLNFLAKSFPTLPVPTAFNPHVPAAGGFSCPAPFKLASLSLWVHIRAAVGSKEPERRTAQRD